MSKVCFGAGVKGFRAGHEGALGVELLITSGSWGLRASQVQGVWLQA